MENLFDTEYWRLLFVTSISPILGYFTPTGGFIAALVIMFAFNVWCGMRADGVQISTCSNFSFKKFKNALFELVLYLLIIEVIFSVMKQCGDSQAAVIAIKSLTYVFMYVYLQNSFKNLMQAYPNKKAIRIVYHIIRFEFIQALPDRIKPIVEEHLDEEEDKDEKKETNN